MSALPFGDGLTVALDVVACCQGFLVFGVQNHWGTEMLHVNERLSAYQLRDSSRDALVAFVGLPKQDPPPIGY